MSKDFIGINHGTGKIDIRDKGLSTQFKPVEIHLKEDGALGDKPSFAFVLTSPGKITVIGQLSLEMWNEGLADIGYELVKK